MRTQPRTHERTRYTYILRYNSTPTPRVSTRATIGAALALHARDVRLLHLLLRHLLARSPVHSPSMDHAVCMHTHMPNMACTWTWTWTWTCTCTTCACACACKVRCTGAGTDATSTHLRARLCAWSVRPAVGAHRQPRAENDLTRSRGWRRARPPRPGSSRYMSAHVSYIHTCMCMCMCMCVSCACACACVCYA
jgi:hypothetical protein